MSTENNPNIKTPQIEWGYNCLTAGVHHGRPEAIWNIPLMYAVKLYSRDVLKELVISRIYNDARQYVVFGEKNSFDSDLIWANRIKKIAEEHYMRTLQHKVGELSNYYDSPGWELESQETARRVTEDILNSHYAPLHPHDSINMLCRIIGSSASRKASANPN